MRHAVALLMLPAFIMLAATYVPHNAIKAKLGHPMVLSVKIWAFAHLLANGRLGDIIFLLLSLSGLSYRLKLPKTRPPYAACGR